MRRCGILILGILSLTTSARGVEGGIVLGMSAAFSGPSRGLGTELYRGARAYFDALNDRGGIGGRAVVIRALDDQYDPDRAIDNTRALLADRSVVTLFNFVGTPTVTRVLPLLKLVGASEDRVSGPEPLLFFAFTGAQPLRAPPYDQLVFNLRASYRDETDALVKNFAAIGRVRIGVFLQADAYGRSGWDGVRRAALRHGASLVGESTYRRGARFDESYQRQQEILRKAGADAVITVGSYAACAGFIRDARDAGWDVPIATLSFVGSENLIALLREASRGGVPDYTQQLVNSQVVPSYDDPELPVVREYRSDMERYPYPGWRGAEPSDYEPMALSAASFEGYLNAKLMAEILRRAEASSDPSDLRAAAESLHAVDLGLDAPVGYGPADHEGLERVYFTSVREGRVVPLDDWTELSR